MGPVEFGGRVYFLILGFASIAVSLVCHLRIKDYGKAVLVSALCMVVGMQVATLVSTGSVDKFWMITLVTLGVPSALMSALVGGAARGLRQVWRRRRETLSVR